MPISKQFECYWTQTGNIYVRTCRRVHDQVDLRFKVLVCHGCDRLLLGMQLLQSLSQQDPCDLSWGSRNPGSSHDPGDFLQS